MIRAALITITFLGVTLTLILMQPASQPAPLAHLLQSRLQTQADIFDETAVSRAETELDVFETLTGMPDASSTISGASAEPAAVTEAAPAAPDPRITTTLDIASSVAALPGAEATTSLPAPATALDRLIINALAQGQSEGYIDALVNDAALKGRIEVPVALVMADGRIDTGPLLAMPLQPLASEYGPGGTYVMQPGGSVASIACRFYGSTGSAADICLANRRVLTSPGGVEAGQSMALPAF